MHSPDREDDSTKGAPLEDGLNGKRAWQTPQVSVYGSVKLATKGISYRMGDGISNLS